MAANNKIPDLLLEDDSDTEVVRSDDAGDHFIQSDPKAKAEELKNKGNVYFGKAKYQEALDLYENALTLTALITRPGDKTDLYVKLKNNVAVCHLRKKDYMNALLSALDGIDAGSTIGRSFLRAAMAFVQLKKPEYSYQTLRKGLERVNCGEKDSLVQELNKLKGEMPRLSKITERNWAEINLRALANKLLPKEKQIQEPVLEPESRKKTKPVKSESPARTHKSSDPSSGFGCSGDTQLEPESLAGDKAESVPDKTTQTQDEFRELVRNGSTSLINNVALTSYGYLKRSTEMIRADYGHLGWTTECPDNPEVVVIRYIFGRACIETNVYDNIIQGKESFELILNFHKSVRFPAVYYGMALLFLKLNRFEQSRQYVRQGLSFLDKGLAFSTQNWPGIPSCPLEETIKENLSCTLENLMTRLKAVECPDAVCRYNDCSAIQAPHHIMPSENIFLSDPDYKGHIQVFCYENCKLEYHKLCWIEVKQLCPGLVKANKVPSDKDLLGQPCLTPDCAGLLVKILIYDHNGCTVTLEDGKLVKKIEEDKRKEKAMAKAKREGETQVKVNHEGKKKRKVKETTPKEEERVKELDNVRTEPYDSVYNQIDYSNVDLTNATMKKKIVPEPSTDNNEININRNKKKANKKATISLQEFNENNSVERNPDNWPGNRTEENNPSHIKLQRFVKEASNYSSVVHPRPTNEIKRPSPPPPPLINPYAPAFVSNITVPPTPSSDWDVLKESFWTFLQDLLQENGPMRSTDRRIEAHIDDQTARLIGGKENVSEFVMLDPKARFRAYKSHICLMKDLAETIQLYSNAAAASEINDQTSRASISDKINLLKKEPVRDYKALKSKLLQNAKQQPLGSAELNNKIGAVNTLSAGVQTDISSLELDDSMPDAFTLQQINMGLVDELSAANDKNTKLQNDKKLETKELTERTKSLTDELAKVKNEVQKLRDENYRVKKTGGEKEEKLKAAIADMDLMRKANEQEQRLGFEWRNKGIQLEEQSKILRLQNDALLESQLKFYINLITERRELNIQSIMFLNDLRQNEMYAPHAEIISMCLKDFNEYAAMLLTAEEEIKRKFETRRRSPATSIEFDLRRIERPKLTSNLFLLVLDVSGPPNTPNSGLRLNSTVPARINTPPSRVTTPPTRVNTPPGVRTMQPPVGAGSSGFLQGKILLNADSVLQSSHRFIYGSSCLFTRIQVVFLPDPGGFLPDPGGYLSGSRWLSNRIQVVI